MHRGYMQAGMHMGCIGSGLTKILAACKGKWNYFREKIGPSLFYIRRNWRLACKIVSCVQAALPSYRSLSTPALWHPLEMLLMYKVILRAQQAKILTWNNRHIKFNQFSRTTEWLEHVLCVQWYNESHECSRNERYWDSSIHSLIVWREMKCLNVRSAPKFSTFC